MTKIMPGERTGFVAIASFTADYGGARVTINAGEWCAYGHELVERFPGRFRRDGTGSTVRPARPPRRRQSRSSRPAKTQPAGAAPGRDASSASGALPLPRGILPVPSGPLLPSHGPEIRLASTASRVPVSLSRFAREEMLAEIAATPYGFETGGLLIGRRPASGFFVNEAHGPGINAERGRNHLRFELAPQLERALERARDPAVSFTACPLGIWHVHPLENVEPSEEDLRIFSAFNRALQAGRSVHVIATPRGVVQAWVVRSDDQGFRGRLLCEPAEVE